MKKLIAILAVVTLAGCSSLLDYIPSRWDANQAKSITDIQLSTRQLDCKGNIDVALTQIETDIQWFQIYAQSKGTKDVGNLSQTIATTVNEFQMRKKQGPVSPVYCDLKKKLMIQQADILARAVQGRF
jgi:hypothetical protein